MICLYTIIINPTSGGGAALKLLPQIEALLADKKLEYCTKIAATPEEASEFAHLAAQNGSEGVIAAGGDGTLSRIINGLAHSDTPLIFAPCGTGNDFVRSLKLPKDPIKALRCQLDARVSRIDLGKVNDTYFLNVSGTGFDVDVLRQAEKYKSKFTGLRAYLCGLFDAIKHFKPMTAMISIDGAPEEKLSFTILSVGNGRYFGGGMKAVPDAKVNDGLFDMIAIRPVKKSTIFMLVFLFVAGLHVKVGLGKLHRCKKMLLRCPDATINIDGELINMDAAEFSIQENALAVKIPSLAK